MDQSVILAAIMLSAGALVLAWAMRRDAPAPPPVGITRPRRGDAKPDGLAIRHDDDGLIVSITTETALGLSCAAAQSNSQARSP